MLVVFEKFRKFSTFLEVNLKTLGGQDSQKKSSSRRIWRMKTFILVTILLKADVTVYRVLDQESKKQS